MTAKDAQLLAEVRKHFVPSKKGSKGSKTLAEHHKELKAKVKQTK